MLFQSLDFLIFYIVVVVLYFLWPGATLRLHWPVGQVWARALGRVSHYRWVLLLAASYYFYAAWAPEYLVWIVVSTLIDYVAGIQIARTTVRPIRKGLLVFSIVSNLGLLFAAKYLNFVNDSLRAVLGWFSVSYRVPVVDVLLPIGISFYTFRTIGYTVDVYRDKVEPERHLGFFALFVSFFPELVAGPIERAGSLLPQLRASHTFSASRAVSGLRLALWGMFKKVVIADRLALYVNTVYNSPANYQGSSVIIATVFFAVQIYCDFSGYSDIALGIGKVMGYDLMQNFGQPYFATSIAAFWRRWHISLSSWFRDYLYIPLGGNRVPKWRWAVNVMIVFLASGLWHGANWTFVLWGGLHGLYYLVEEWTRRMHFIRGIRDRGAQLFRLENRRILQRAIGGLATFVLVCFAWVFFRANSVSDALLLIGSVMRIGSAASPMSVADNLRPADELRPAGAGGLSPVLVPWGNAVGNPRLEMVFAFALIALLAFVDWIQSNPSALSGADSASGVGRTAWMQVLDPGRNVWIRWAIYLLLALAIMNLGVSQGTPFVYSQF